MTALGRGFGGAGVGAAAGDGGDDEFGVTEFRSIWSYCCAGGDDAIGVVVMMPLAVVLIFINGSLACREIDRDDSKMERSFPYGGLPDSGDASLCVLFISLLCFSLYSSSLSVFTNLVQNFVIETENVGRGDYNELDINIVKATNHVERPAKERHIRAIFAAISATRPRPDVAYCIHALARRLSKTHNWGSNQPQRQQLVR
ncbi:hypothetical protein F0562_030165 [Nyssa sinensis]|uniref:ENTH domain-containing protein n=1 Tax=Nyssa sinensis TaxID=561372 RepID=A0A5J5AZT6_9ASTE|nr:hypothetical protein F0562_030165 [Nyssa sinensis]